MKLFPKNNFNSFRLIVTNNKFNKSEQHTYKAIKYKINVITSNIISQKLDFEKWCSFLNRCGAQRIYACKLDLADAYGNVKIGILYYFVNFFCTCCMSKCLVN